MSKFQIPRLKIQGNVGTAEEQKNPVRPPVDDKERAASEARLKSTGWFDSLGAGQESGDELRRPISEKDRAKLHKLQMAD